MIWMVQQYHDTAMVDLYDLYKAVGDAQDVLTTCNIIYQHIHVTPKPADGMTKKYTIGSANTV